jgi:hypothetical protein
MLKLRMLSQGIAGPRFEKPEEVVEWMGAMQAQEIRAVKWAVGLRVAKPSLTAVQEAFRADFAYSRDASYVALYSGEGYKMDD